MRAISALVSSNWLKQQLLNRNGSLKILDSSWAAVKNGKEDFLSKHIPGAQFFDLNQCVRPEPTLPRNLPDPPCFQNYLQSLGVNTDSHLVVYDRGGILPSARTWWLCRAYGHQSVSVLDGGLKKWENDGYETTSGEEEATQRGNFVVKMNDSLVTSFDKMLDTVSGKLGDNTSQVLDARKPEHFLGEENEPTKATTMALQGMNQPIPDQMHRGRIPGSRNMLEDFVLRQNDKCLQSKEDLLELFHKFGVDLGKPLVTTCYSGNAACLLALAAHVCGKEDVSVYYGAWTEWGQRAPGELVVGPGTPAKAKGG